MKAAVLRAPRSPFTIEEVDLEPPGRGEVLVRVSAAGVCRSDAHVMSGATPHPMPVVCGHEGAGVVQSIGPGVSRVKAGDCVVLSWAPFCGACFFCRAGLPAQCEAYIDAIWAGTMADGSTRLSLGGRPLHHYAALACFAEACVVPESCCVTIPPDVPHPAAALVGCSVATGVCAALRRAKVARGSSACVIGCGGVGLGIVQGCRLAAADRIIAVDLSPFRLERAREMGATHVVDAGRDDPVRSVRDLTGGRGADYSFEAVGTTATMARAIESARRGGTAVLVGLGPRGSALSLDAGSFTRSDRTLMTAYYGGCDPQRDMPWLVDLYRDRKLKLDELIGRRRPLAEINEAFEDLESGDHLRTVLLFEPPGRVC